MNSYEQAKQFKKILETSAEKQYKLQKGLSVRVGEVVSYDPPTQKAEVRLAGDALETTSFFSDKTGQLLSPGDEVYILILDGSLTNSFIAWKKGFTSAAGGGLKILGSFSSSSQLPPAGSSEIGDAYLINGDLWVFDSVQYVNAGPVQGPQGPIGPKGDKGDKGDKGNSFQYQWNNTELGVRVEGDPSFVFTDLQGPKGDKGDKGDTGEKGDTGDPTGPHASQHVLGGDDYLSPESIGAATSLVLTGILSKDSWNEETGYYTQTISLTGINENDYPIVDIDLRDISDFEDKIEIVEAWGEVLEILTFNGEASFSSREDLKVDIPIILKVVR